MEKDVCFFFFPVKKKEYKMDKDNQIDSHIKQGDGVVLVGS